MKRLIPVLFIVLIFALLLPFTEGRTEKRSLDITSLIISFDKANATFTVNYDFGSLPKLYILFLGSKGIEPKIKAAFKNFDYEILRMDQDKAILRVKNISRLDRSYYLHDSHKFGESVRTIYVYTPDSPDPKKYSNPYLFSWDSVPGNESFKLLKFLKDDLEVNWTDNAKITKTDDSRTIRVYYAEDWAYINLDESKARALLKISDGRIYNLQIKEDRGKLYIHSPYLYSTPATYYRS